MDLPVAGEVRGGPRASGTTGSALPGERADPQQQRGGAMFRCPDVLAIILPPHLTHVPQPRDIWWAQQFKAKATEA